jgi:transposase
MQSEGNAPKKWRIKSWFLLHDNAPAHRSVSVKYFLAKNSVTTLEQPPYCAGLAPADFYLLPRLESALKESSCCDANDITKNTTEELKRLPK